MLFDSGSMMRMLFCDRSSTLGRSHGREKERKTNDALTTSLSSLSAAAGRLIRYTLFLPFFASLF